VLAVRTARAIPKLERDSQTRRDAYFDRRRESRKLESLLHKAEEKEHLETERRERSELDDLLQARRYYKWQRSKKEAK
jgi:flagellar biosynthesis chaperone FliJ